MVEVWILSGKTHCSVMHRSKRRCNIPRARQGHLPFVIFPRGGHLLSRKFKVVGHLIPLVMKMGIWPELKSFSSPNMKTSYYRLTCYPLTQETTGFTVDFMKLWPQMLQTSLRSLEVHIGIHKPICKQSPWLVPEVQEANQIHSLHAGFESHYELLNLAMNLQTSQRKFGTFVVKVSWNRLSQKHIFCFFEVKMWIMFKIGWTRMDWWSWKLKNFNLQIKL